MGSQKDGYSLKYFNVIFTKSIAKADTSPGFPRIETGSVFDQKCQIEKQILFTIDRKYDERSSFHF